MRKKLRIGIVGCGAIGSQVAVFIDKKFQAKGMIVAVCDVRKEKVEGLLARLKNKPKSTNLDILIKRSDIIIEVASFEAARTIVKKTARLNKNIIILSIGAFARYRGLLSTAKTSKSNVYIPSGAIAGIDGISSLSRGTIKRLILTTSKPPRSLAGVRFLERQGIDVFKIKKEQVVFRGSIQEAVKNFPKNINVAATLFMASGFGRIEVVIKVNPRLKRNRHHIQVLAEEGSLTIEVENAPSPGNPKTSYLTILSVEKLLEKITSHLKVGS